MSFGGLDRATCSYHSSVSANPASTVFDAELDQIVRNFQRDHRLDVDGLAGQQTQIIINSLLTVDGTPRLSSALLAKD